MTLRAIRFLPGDAPFALSLAYGNRLVVPNDVDGISGFALVEREAWFEPEVAFLRATLPRGAHALDVGANIGVYASAMALAVGPGGRVMAFEPNPEALALLEANAAAAACPVVVDARAVAASSGRARFAPGEISELGALDAGDGADTIDIDAVALDAALVDARWSELDFIKLDVEGGEAAAIDGAEATLERFAPAVMLEIENKGPTDFTALDALEARGFAAYRLVPSLGVLAPFERAKARGQLNVFALTPTTAARWAGRGALTREPAPPPANDGDYSAYFARLAPATADKRTAARWRASAHDPGSTGYRAGLGDLIAARAPSRQVATRLALLGRARERLAQALADRSSLARRASLIACDLLLDDRAAVDDGVEAALAALARGEDCVPDEPVIPPLRRFENQCVGVDSAAWLRSAILAAFLESRLSARFDPERCLAAAVALDDAGYACSAVLRRRQLLSVLLGHWYRPNRDERLCAPRPDHLNADLWRRAF